jgi:hypothetical protein
MRRKAILLMGAVLFFLSSYSAIAFGFDSGSTGADGALNPTSNTVIQLPASGILNYTTVDIPTGVTVTFTSNAANTPVYMLATEDVTIEGTISVNGTDASGMYSGKGGPGGFDGGLGGTYNLQGGKGLGPGGGNPGSVSTSPGFSSGGGGGGGFGAAGSNGSGLTCGPGGAGGGVYSNDRIIPMIGGSGGGAGSGSANSQNTAPAGGGGGGGGAIVIASSGTITVTGSITANGGKGGQSSGNLSGSGGGGSGGSIKLMATTITGEGTISVSGGSYFTTGEAGGAGGAGKIRFEADTVTRTSGTTPAYTFGYPSSVFVTNVPTLTITSVAGVTVPSNPSGKFGSPDVTLPSTTTNPVTINISGTNIPVNTTVTVTATPSNGASTSASASLTGNDASATTASVSITLSTSYQTIVMAQATFTIQTAMYYDGEKIEKVRVASTMGGKSETVYITKTGREIKAELLAGIMK